MTTRKKTPAALKSYIEDLDDLPLDILLGRIVLFTITEEPIAHAELEKRFVDNGLDLTLMPSPNKRLDAFKKATSDTKDSYALPRNRTAHLLSRDVSSTTEYVQRQITREVVESSKRKLGYVEAITCRFYRPSDPANQETASLRLQIKAQNLEQEEVRIVQTVAADIQRRYEHYYENLDSQKIRATVRAYLKKLNAVEIKGGVYYVPVSRDEELSRLATLVDTLGGGCHMNMIPIVNLERERVFLSRVFEREAADALSNITKEVDELIASRKSGITGTTYARMKAAYDQIMDNAVEHMGNLQLSQDMTTASATVAERALMRLQTAMLDD